MTTAASGEGANREDLVERLFTAFSVQLDEIEARISGAEGHEILEDAKVLSGLARTLETLIALDKKVGHEEEGAPDLEAVRAELAERLAHLDPRTRRGGGKATGRKPPARETRAGGPDPETA